MKSFAKNTTALSRKIVLIILSSLLLVVGVYAATAYAIKLFPFNTAQPTDSSGTGLSLTEEEKRAADDAEQKESNIVTAAESDSPKPERSLVIAELDSIDGIVSLRAYIGNFNDEGGVCKVSFTKEGASSVVTSSNAFSDASTTQCGANDTPLTAFSTKGTWNVVVEYTSKTTTLSTKGELSL